MGRKLIAHILLLPIYIIGILYAIIWSSLAIIIYIIMTPIIYLLNIVNDTQDRFPLKEVLQFTTMILLSIPILKDVINKTLWSNNE